ncbi:hypothetical protein [Segatella bryantii]|uniref:hypothetical protein n=1 Tax=Segatella bryantii TaxID=77095 RepID=UPI00242E48F7|nr:hypothetical protein [Segatella bryantii]
MKDIVELVIKIPEEIMEYIKNNDCLSVFYIDEVAKAIKNGTPLPKGHGRLIDEEQIPGDGGWDFSDRLMLTPTIIEADKESEE